MMGGKFRLQSGTLQWKTNPATQLKGKRMNLACNSGDFQSTNGILECPSQFLMQRSNIQSLKSAHRGDKSGFQKSWCKGRHAAEMGGQALVIESTGVRRFAPTLAGRFGLHDVRDALDLRGASARCAEVNHVGKVDAFVQG